MLLTSVLFVNMSILCVRCSILFETWTEKRSDCESVYQCLLLAEARHGNPLFHTSVSSTTTSFIHSRHRNQYIVYMEWLRRGSKM